MKRGIFIVTGMLVVCLVIWFIVDQSGPKEKILSTEKRKEAMAKILDREPILTNKKENGWKVYDGRFITFSYPSDAIIHNNASLPPSILESFQCSMLAERLNLTVQVTAGQTLSDHAGVKLRENQSNLYDKGNAVVAGVSGVVFTKDSDDGVEKTGFFVKDGRLYSLSVTGGSVKKVSEFFDKVLLTIQVD